MTTRARRFKTRWSLVRSVSEIPDKGNCSNQDSQTLELSKVILHYPDQGDGKDAVDPGCGTYMNYRLQIYVSGS